MLRRVRASVRIAGLVVFGPGHTRHALGSRGGGSAVPATAAKGAGPLLAPALTLVPRGVYSY